MFAAKHEQVTRFFCYRQYNKAILCLSTTRREHSQYVLYFSRSFKIITASRGCASYDSSRTCSIISHGFNAVVLQIKSRASQLGNFPSRNRWIVFSPNILCFLNSYVVKPHFLSSSNGFIPSLYLNIDMPPIYTLWCVCFVMVNRGLCWIGSDRQRKGCPRHTTHACAARSP